MLFGPPLVLLGLVFEALLLEYPPHVFLLEESDEERRKEIQTN